MKKLLHERLREYGSNCRADYKDWLSQRHANELADEIEKYYIPRPRFEDGEPVHFDDRFYSGYTHAIETVSSMKFTPGGFKLNGGLRYDYGEPVRRCLPEPKVLDADGVEIKVGDTVWHKEMGIKFLVTKLPTPDYYSSVEVKTTELPIYTTGYDPNLLTHSEPDSLEKLRDDIAGFKAEGTYHGAIDAFLQRCEDRLTAIMERDA